MQLRIRCGGQKLRDTTCLGFAMSPQASKFSTCCNDASSTTLSGMRHAICGPSPHLRELLIDIQHFMMMLLGAVIVDCGSRLWFISLASSSTIALRNDDLVYKTA
jgi:hypothetical protein